MALKGVEAMQKHLQCKRGSIKIINFKGCMMETIILQTSTRMST